MIGNETESKTRKAAQINKCKHARYLGTDYDMHSIDRFAWNKHKEWFYIASQTNTRIEIRLEGQDPVLELHANIHYHHIYIGKEAKRMGRP